MSTEFDTTTFLAAADEAARLANRDRVWFKAQAPEKPRTLAAFPLTTTVPPAVEGSATNSSIGTSGARLARTNLKQIRLARRARQQDYGVTCISMFLGTLVVCASVILLNHARSSTTLAEYWNVLSKLWSSLF